MGHSISVKHYDFPEGIVSVDITYNLSDMYYLACKNAWYNVEHFWEYINGKQMKDLKQFFIDLRNELESNPKKYKKLNPENWWWSYDWLVKNLWRLIIAANEAPDEILEDWY